MPIGAVSTEVVTEGTLSAMEAVVLPTATKIAISPLSHEGNRSHKKLPPASPTRKGKAIQKKKYNNK